MSLALTVDPTEGQTPLTVEATVTYTGSTTVGGLVFVLDFGNCTKPIIATIPPDTTNGTAFARSYTYKTAGVFVVRLSSTDLSTSQSKTVTVLAPNQVYRGLTRNIRKLVTVLSASKCCPQTALVQFATGPPPFLAASFLSCPIGKFLFVPASSTTPSAPAFPLRGTNEIPIKSGTYLVFYLYEKGVFGVGTNATNQVILSSYPQQNGQAPAAWTYDDKTGRIALATYTQLAWAVDFDTGFVVLSQDAADAWVVQVTQGAENGQLAFVLTTVLLSILIMAAIAMSFGHTSDSKIDFSTRDVVTVDIEDTRD